MIRILLTALIAVAAMPFVQRPAQAAEPPWCLISGFGDEHCRYSSLDDCLRDRSGSGFCNPNPRFRGSEPPRQRRPERRR